MSRWVLDASALLALLQQEPGAERVAAALLEGAIISAVNLSEVVARLIDHQMPEAAVRAALGALDLTVVDLDEAGAYQAGFLRPGTRTVGLSLGDRVCLALAEARQAIALTADRAWSRVQSTVAIELIR